MPGSLGNGACRKAVGIGGPCSLGRATVHLSCGGRESVEGGGSEKKKHFKQGSHLDPQGCGKSGHVVVVLRKRSESPVCAVPEI